MTYIRGFDGLRAISITMVVLTHLGAKALLPDNDYIKNRVWELCAGVTGVNVFFAISGFLITRILLQEKSSTGSISFKNFYARRFLRLLPPLLLFYTAIVVLMKFDLIKTSLTSVFLSFFYLYNYTPYSIYSEFLGHTWSLAVEEQFYLLWPFVVASLAPNRMVRLTALIAFLSLLGFYLIAHVSYEHNGVVYTLNSWFYAHRLFIPAVGPIMIGAGCSVMVFYQFRFVKKWLSLAGTPWYCLLLFASPLYLPGFLFAAFPLVQAVGISLLLAWIFNNQQSTLTNVLEWKPLSFVGKISYGLYVYQGLFLGTSIEGNSIWIQQFPQNLIFTVGVAVLSFYFLEKPVLKFKKYFVTRQQPAGTAAAKKFS